MRQALVDPLAAPETLPLGGALALQHLDGSATLMLGVFVRTDGPAGIAAIRQAGGDVGAVLGDYVSARIPVDALDVLTASPDIIAVEAARALRMDNDSGAHAIGADQVRTLVDGRWQGVTGRGAIVAVYDTGIDFSHEDFIDPDGKTRLLGLWDQTQSGVPPVGFTFGNYCSPSSIQTAIDTNGTGGCQQVDFHGHGTHVAGTAAGDGSAGSTDPQHYPYAGIAPDAGLLIVNGGPGTFFEDRIIDGLTWLRQEGLRLGMPIVVNLSLGGQFGAHDGSRMYERMIDALSGPGFIVVVAAGNAGVNGNTTPVLSGALIHARGIPTATQATELTFEIPPYTPNTDPCNGNRINMSLWYEPGDSLEVEVIRPDATRASQSRGQASLDEGAGRIIIDNGSGGVNPENGDVEATITLNGCGSSTVPAAGTWRIRVTPTKPGSGLPFDLWIWLATGPQPEGRIGFDNRMIVGSPGNARRSITAGAFVTRLCWLSISSTNPICYTQKEQLGDLARFSAGGPTRDGRIKPDIAAPGLAVFSSQSGDASISAQRRATDNEHAVREGTSMATPHVAGTIALMLAGSPTLTPEDIRAAIATGASADAFTLRTYDPAPAAMPSDWWGYGKLNVPESLLALSGGGPATLQLAAEPALAAGTTIGRKGTRLSLLKLELEAQGFESIDVTSIGFDVTGDDPAARVVLLRDNGNGIADDNDIELAGSSVALTAATRRVVIQPPDLRIAPFTPLTVLLAVELSGDAPNGAAFEAVLAPEDLHTIGASTGELDRIESGIAAVSSGVALSTVLEGESILSFSQNPVRSDAVTFNFEQPPTLAAVYTVTGRRVIDLCSSDASLACGAAGGPTASSWDLRNNEGERVAPGVYLVIFSVSGQTFREKLMVITPGSDPDPREQQQ